MADDLARATGVAHADLESLVRAGLLEGTFYLDGRFAGMFDDVLPSAEKLVALGLVVRGDYDPKVLRSNEDDEDDDDQSEGQGPSWTMSWPE